MPAVPTPRRFLNAFKRIQVTDFQKRMLGIHHASPKRTITAVRMAKALGYSHHGPVCNSYGSLGQALGRELRWKPGDHVGHGVARLAVLEKHHGIWRWIMRPEVAAAIEELGWVVPAELAEESESDIFRIGEPLVVRYPDGEERLVAELFAHGDGAVFFECGWVFQKEPVQLLPGPIVKEGEGCWRFGDIVVRVVTREEFPVLALQAELLEQFNIAEGRENATRERAYEIFLGSFGKGF